MDELFYRASLAALIVAFFLIRAPSVRKASKTEKVEEKKPVRERIMVFFNFVGMMLLPFVYILTPWLDLFGYPLFEMLRIVGIALFVFGLVLLAWVHRTLGKHWSMMLKLGDEHSLVTTGPYARVRHPMYTYFFIMVISTALISANLFVGVAGIGFWTILYFVRINDEESMLLEQFGEAYEGYTKETGRLIPPLRKRNA
jgi:protein-S-isoprenylcysteine O-methyltransferase Ste14